MAHTPGPWQLGGPHGHNACTVHASNGTDGVASVYGMPLHSKLDEIDHEKWANGLANARLIAAAPELLEALRPFSLNARAISISDALGHVDREDLLRAASAIAKATGNT